jgi:hypothetical protein
MDTVGRKRYLDLGPKRSLRKALADEPDTKGATKEAKKSPEAKKLSDVSVPGAWSRAAKVWNWKERAKAYDDAQIEKQAAFVRETVVHQPFASRSYRIIYLCGMAEAMDKVSTHGFTLEENINYIKTMQSLFKDIEHLMEEMDETTLMTADASAHKHLIEKANKQNAKSL